MSIREVGFWPLLSLSLIACLVGCGGGGSGGDPPTDESSVKETVRRIPGAAHAALAFSPDGKVLAAATHNSLHLYDIASGQELSSAEVQSEVGNVCRHIAFSPDGRHIASAHMGRRLDHPYCFVYLWEVTGETRLRQARTLFTRKRDGMDSWTTVFHVGFSPDGQTVVSGSCDGTVYLWETATGKERLRLPGGMAATFSADGKTVIALSHDGLVSQWHPVTGEAISRGQQGGRKDFIHVTDAAFAPGGKTVAVHDDYMVCLREVRTGEQVRRLSFPRGVCCPALSPDGRVLAVAADEGIRFFNGTTGQELGWRKGRGAIAFSADGRHIAFAEDDGVVIREVEDVLTSGGKPPVPALTDPPGMPLEAELIVKQDTYVLDRGGRTAEAFSQHIITHVTPTPRLDLVFRLRNTGDQKLTIPPDPHVYLSLIGEGALNFSESYQTGVVTPPPPITLAPGESHSLPITDFRCSPGQSSYWLLPGEYNIQATCVTRVSPAPKEAKPDSDGSASIWVYSPSVKLKVVAARK